MACACVFLFCAGLDAQNSPSNGGAPAANSTNIASPGKPHEVVELEGPWRFNVGDDADGRLGWSSSAFDDSHWSQATLSQSLTEQGFDPYTGYGWYRLRLRPEQLAQWGGLSANSPGNAQAADNTQMDLLVTGDSVGQLAVFVNGMLVGETNGMRSTVVSDQPRMYASPPLVVHLGRPAGDGTFEIAIRSWAGPSLPIHRGLLAKVELGAQADIADRLVAATNQQWVQHEIAGVVVSFLFFCVAMLGATLFMAQRNHSEYLWLTLMCLTVAFTGAEEFAFRQALLPNSVFNVLNLWMGRIFMAVTLEFVLRFTGGSLRRAVRVVQVSVLLLPFLSFLGIEHVYGYLSVSAEVVFTALVSVLLFRAWRRGLHEAGVMLVPFILAATADSLDTVLGYLASNHWISQRFAYHQFHLGPVEFPLSIVTYSIFLGSLLAVILYRFINVSQEEQRSMAEIEAARSVQAMLIPTELPSNHNFMLESAYLPAKGVGGDFFQVLPLKDDSILVVVGDVSGKGLQAAMSASTLVGALRNELSSDPATVLNRLNNVLLGAAARPGADLSKKATISFATCVCARVYPDGTMTIANAGHLHPYRDGREIDLVADLPLGVVPDVQYEQASFELNVGDRLIFLSDGVVEATNAHGELFGFERTQQVSNESARYIAQTAKRFGQNDDITVVSLYFAARTAQRAGKRVPQEV
jgi:hypothetical protein